MKNTWATLNINLDHDYAIAAWILSVMPEVKNDVDTRITDKYHEAVERIVERIHPLSCPNKSVDI